VAIAAGVVATGVVTAAIVGAQASTSLAAIATPTIAVQPALVPSAQSNPAQSAGTTHPVFLARSRDGSRVLVTPPHPAKAPLVVTPIPGAKVVEWFGTHGPSWKVAHSGLDFQADTGTKAYAVVAGTIRSIFVHPAYGNVIELRREDGTEIWYCHLSRPLVLAGQHVDQGQLIARTGATGNTTGPHLHLEVRVKHVPTDPVSFLVGTPGKPGRIPAWAKAYKEEPPAGNPG